MRICLIYDCLYPYTIGGAERWYRSLAEHLRDAGHEITYLTLRQWPSGQEPDLPGVDVVSVGPQLSLYKGDRRRVGPPVRFGAGVLAHLARHGGRYDVVHTASFPYFSLFAAGAVRRLRRLELVVDWHEVWTRQYWHRYAGSGIGEAGWRIQRRCARIPHRAFCFSKLHARRLVEEGYRGEPTLLRGEYAGPLEPAPPIPAEPVVVFAGRHIPEKRARSLVPAFALARERLPDLRLEIYGDGPDRPALLRDIAESGLAEWISAPGFVDEAALATAIGRALCLVLPSEREGYGLIVVEAAARGVPSVVVRGPDNAATELVEEGVNGIVSASAAPEELAAGIVAVHQAGEALRESTAAWFARNAGSLSLARSLEIVLATYAVG